MHAAGSSSWRAAGRSGGTLWRSLAAAARSAGCSPARPAPVAARRPHPPHQIRGDDGTHQMQHTPLLDAMPVGAAADAEEVAEEVAEEALQEDDLKSVYTGGSLGALKACRAKLATAFSDMASVVATVQTMRKHQRAQAEQGEVHLFENASE